jgi:predicted small secreted protein
MRSFKRSAILLAVLGLISFAMVACNTVEGAGKDIEATGEAIEDAAD